MYVYTIIGGDVEITEAQPPVETVHELYKRRFGYGPGNTDRRKAAEYVEWRYGGQGFVDAVEVITELRIVAEAARVRAIMIEEAGEMANDRLFIKCDTCGGWKMLMTHMGAGLSTRDNDILAWLDAHGGCHPRAFSPHLGGIPGFSLHTEDAIGEGLELLPARQNGLPPRRG